jgi:hypothetical protein
VRPQQDTVAEVERSTLSVNNRAVATLTTSKGLDVAKRDGISFRLAFIDEDFAEPHLAEFDHADMMKLFERARAKARAGYTWRACPPRILSTAVGEVSALWILYVSAFGPCCLGVREGALAKNAVTKA